MQRLSVKSICVEKDSLLHRTFRSFLAILGYKRGSTTKDEAKEVLKKISNIDYNNSVKDIVAEILAEPIVEDEVEIVEEEIKSTKFKKISKKGGRYRVFGIAHFFIKNDTN